MKPEPSLLAKLNLTEIQDQVGKAFCVHTSNRHRCFKMSVGDCRFCEDILTFLTTHDMEYANNRDALILWRLSHYAKDMLNIYRSEPKKKVRSYHAQVNPLASADAIMKELFK